MWIELINATNEHALPPIKRLNTAAKSRCGFWLYGAHPIFHNIAESKLSIPAEWPENPLKLCFPRNISQVDSSGLIVES